MKEENKIIAGLLGLLIFVSGTSAYVINNLNKEIKLQAEEINNLKKKYEELTIDSYDDEKIKNIVDSSFDEDCKYVVLETNKYNHEKTYCAVEDLVVITNDYREKVLVDTKTHYLYKDILDYSKLESFEDYLIGAYIRTSDYNTKEIIKSIVSEDKNKIETIDRNMLNEINIDKTSYDVVLMDSMFIDDSRNLISSVKDGGKKLVYTIKR